MDSRKLHYYCSTIVLPLSVYLICRALVDCNSQLGKEYILSSFPYEEDKVKALRILATVSVMRTSTIFKVLVQLC